MDESLDKYYEGREVPEYKTGEVSLLDKINFLIAYEEGESYSKFLSGFPDFMVGKDGYIGFEDFQKEYPQQNGYGWKCYLAENNEADFEVYFNSMFPGLMAKFEEKYEENRYDWNSGRWRKDEDGVWCEYSTYNPDSKWDWYSVGGRWDNEIKTKSGEYTNECLLEEIDWSEPKEGEDYHYSAKEVPFCLVVDGKWAERGEMGWWTIVTNEKDKEDWNKEFMSIIETLPADSQVTNVDFHI
jgi:hypothetical protein